MSTTDRRHCLICGTWWDIVDEDTPRECPTCEERGTATLAAEPPAEGYGLVMPFVTAASKGGPHEDIAYVAGYEMGQLDARLTHPGSYHAVTIRAENRAQADLIAMRHGYAMRVIDDDREWIIVEFSAPPDAAEFREQLDDGKQS